MDGQFKLILAVATAILYRFKDYRMVQISFTSVSNSMYWDVQAEVQSPDMRKDQGYLIMSGTGDTPLQALKAFAEKADSWLEHAEREIEIKRIKRAKQLVERIEQDKERTK